jgi:hypothetical protein
MDYHTYTSEIGPPFAALQRVELRLRVYLETARSKQRVDLAAYLCSWKIGELVPENEFTNQQYFSALLSRYNLLAPENLKIDKKLNQYRNTIAHGRIFLDPTRADALRLINFSPGPKGSIMVNDCDTLDATHAWFGSIVQEAKFAANRVQTAIVALENSLGIN